MSEREIAGTPERQEILQSAEAGELHWFNPGGLGGSYLHRGVFIHKQDRQHPVRLLMEAQALIHAEPIMVNGQGRRRVRITSVGVALLAKWRIRQS